VAVKVCTQSANKINNRELEAYYHLNSLTTEHPECLFIRGLLDVFNLQGPKGEHVCLVQPPMHMTIRELQYQNASRRLNESLLKWTLHKLLMALSFLHDEARVVHAGTVIQPGRYFASNAHML
jgi:hypothetical protein